MIARVTVPADLGVEEAAEALRARTLSSRELVESCLERIRERDGTHSHDGDPDSINAWVRVYDEDALEAATRADEQLARGDAPRLCGIPIGLKDLYAVAGKPLTASSTLLYEVPDRDCDVWALPRRRGHGAARPRAHARVRLRRHHRPGRQPLGARAVGRRLRWGVERGARVPSGTRGHGHRHRGLVAHPLGRVRDVDDQADAGFRLDAGGRPAGVDVRPSRADDPDGRRLRARARRDVGCDAAGVAATATPLRRLSTHLRARAGRRRRVRSGARGASGRARRATAPAGPARRPRRLLRSRPHRDARLPPPLRRPAGRVSPVQSGTARARGA